MNRGKEKYIPVTCRKNWKHGIGIICGKTILGAAIGVAGGMALVAGAAAVEGAVLSGAIFAKVLGIAGAAGGASHGIISITEKNKKGNGGFIKTEEKN